MIELQHITKIFMEDTGVEVSGAYNIYLSIKEGEWYNLVGPNGSGKTTLLRLLAGEITPSSGSILYNGEDITSWGQEKRAHIFQFIEQDTKNNLVPSMTVEENLMLCFNGHKFPGLRLAKRADRKIQIVECLRNFGMGIEHRLSTQIRYLYGGEKQTIVLAKTILERAEILLLDEFVAALDPKTAPHLLSMVRKLAAERKITVISVSHDIDQIVSCSGFLVFLNEGKLFATIEKEAVSKERIISLFGQALQKEKIKHEEG